MSGMQSILLNGISQASSGKELNSDTIDMDSSSPVSSASPDSEDTVRAEDSTSGTDGLESEDTAEDSPDSVQASGDTSKPGSKQKTSDSEVITITDDSGRRKVEVDFNNREQLKKYVQMAHGARKWQSERDQAIQSHKEASTKLGEREKDWQALEQAFKQGPEHLVDLLSGRKGAFEEVVSKRMERERILKGGNAAEIQALEARDAHEKQAAEFDKIRKENEDFKKQVSEEREQAELRSTESKINPVFHKHRFAGKLGDANDEQLFDEMLWNSALKRLEPYEEKGLELTPELVEREFASVATVLRKRIGVQAEKKATRVVEQKKQEATEHAQASAKSGYKKGGNAEEARKLLNNGDLKGILKNWGKYGSLFNK